MSKRAKVTAKGDLECPSCETIFVTPTGLNPYRGGEREKMIVRAGQDYDCHCGTPFTVTEKEALKHNRFWFPTDPAFTEGQ